MTEQKICRGLDANALKLIAIAAMTVDHVAWLLFPGYPAAAVPVIMHIIGRITCPIMCFFIAEGFYHTHDRKKYALRLLALAVVSHFAYLLASNNYLDPHSFIPFYYGGALNQTSVIRMRSPVRIWVTAPKKPVIVAITGFLFLFKIAKARWQ